MRRRSAARMPAQSGWGVLGHEDSGTPLHEDRLDVVTEILIGSGAASVLDLGCGSGALLTRLLGHHQFTRIVGMDVSLDALISAERLRPPTCMVDGDRLSLLHGSFTTIGEGLTGFDAAAMVEVIEHIDPARLSSVERTIFAMMRPALVVMTTPNREYNELYGLAEGQLRHPDHRFEWTRSRFQSWATGVGGRNGYNVEFGAVGPGNVWSGSPTQLAIFRLDDG